MEYDYATGDLLLTPQKYQYTRYAGQAFIDAWHTQRGVVMAQLPAPAPDPFFGSKAGRTYAELREVCEVLRAGGGATAITSMLLFYMKKFEVAKRLYQQYGANGKPQSGWLDYRVLSNYLLLAEGCIQHWHVDQANYWVNTLLKLNDTLSTQWLAMSEREQAYFHWILQQEAKLIQQLAERSL